MLKLGGTFQILGFTSLVLQTGNLSPQIRKHVLRSNCTSEAMLSLTHIFSSPEWLPLSPSPQPPQRSYFEARISLKWHQPTPSSGVFLPQGARARAEEKSVKWVSHMSAHRAPSLMSGTLSPRCTSPQVHPDFSLIKCNLLKMQQKGTLTYSDHGLEGHPACVLML